MLEGSKFSLQSASMGITVILDNATQCMSHDNVGENTKNVVIEYNLSDIDIHIQQWGTLLIF